MAYKVCILAAGKGTRNTTYDGLHKALYPIANKPAIAYTIDRIPKDIEIVVAIGHKRHQVRTCLEYLYPDRKFTFVNVDNYDGPGSGPGYSLLQCEPHLRCPFIWTPVDSFFQPDTTLFESEPTCDWVGTKGMSGNLTKYCLYDHLSGSLFYAHDPFCGTAHVFIGTAGVCDYESFWNRLKYRKDSLYNNELQVKEGFARKVTSKVDRGWQDIGNNDGYQAVCAMYPSPHSVPKPGQALIIHNNKVMKWFEDAAIVGDLLKRALFLTGVIPQPTLVCENVIGYDFIEGTMLSDRNCPDEFRNFMIWYLDTIVHDVPPMLHPTVPESMSLHSIKFRNRIEPFIDSSLDNLETINGIAVPPIMHLDRKIKWAEIELSIKACYFHGDPQLENVICKPDGGYVVIDWRAKPLSGDLYYDLAKIYHSLLINGRVIRNREFSVKIDGTNGDIEYRIRNNLLDFLHVFRNVVLKFGLDWERVVLLGILQYLHIASLYLETDKEYATFLFLLGKLELHKFFLEEYQCTMN